MEKNLHVVMLPWSAFGHLIPFYHLAVGLAKSKIHVSFVSTPKNILRLPKIPPELSQFIHLMAIPLPRCDVHHLLPESAEATTDIPTQKIQYLKRAVDLLRQPFKEFVARTSPDWVIVDFHAYWAGEIYEEFQIPVVLFWIFSSLCFLYNGPPDLLSKDSEIMARISPATMAVPPEWVDFPTTVTYNLHEPTIMYSALFETNASGISDGERLRRLFVSCQALAIRSSEEIEGGYLTLLKRLITPKVICIGVLPPEKQPESNHEVIKWLDEQRVGSVVYAAFGSECNLTREQVHEIAYGLELSELPFLWALKKPSWAAQEEEDASLLPLGFQERTFSRGIASIEWLPQLEIMAHRAIGVSLIHGGWSSTIETLQVGLCLVILPFAIDQPLIAKLLVEKGMAIEIRRNGDNGWFGREDVANALKEAMKSLEEGGQLKIGATEAAAIIADQKLQWEHSFGGFVRFLRNKP